MAYPPQHSPLLGDPASPGSPAFRESANSPYLYSDDGASNNQYSSMDGQSTLGLHARQRSYTDDKEEDLGVTTPALGAGAAVGDAGRGPGFWSRLSQRAKRLLIMGIILLLVILIIAIAVPTAIRKSNAKPNVAVAAEGDDSKSSSSKASSSRASSSATRSSSSSAAAPTPSGRPAWGGDGSTVYAEDGSTFVYQNSFGGFWNAVPFNDSARAQSFSPALNEPWDYNVNTIRGVNLGGWLTIEPFIVPGLFEPFNEAGINPDATVVDEWTLCLALGSNMSAVITEHYDTFITEKDFAEIAAAGLNWIRLPVPWWIIEVWDDEPFLANVGWSYFLKAISWARKYGLRINLDLHAVPGSQNGYNHSGKLGSVNFLQSVMGIANAQRTLNYIRTLTQFISQDEYKNVVPMFSILNEPYGPSIGMEPVRHFYLEVYNMMREIAGNGAGNGPFIAFHDAFAPQPSDVADADFDVAHGGWNGWMPGSDRVALDTHPYMCFSEPNNDPLSFQASKPCSYWGAKMNITSATFGLSIAGEWSLAVNDCGKWLNQVGNGQRFDGTYYYPGTTTRPFKAVGSCDEWNNYDTWTDATKEGLRNVALAHMDSFRHFFFWTWKTGYSTQLGKIANPFWSYSLGLAEGWVPKDPRAASGICPSLVQAAGVKYPTFPAPPLSAWQTGGAGAGTMLDTAMEASYTAWPPASLGTLAVSDMPTFTPTGSVVTLKASRPTSFPEGYATATPNVGDGWFNAEDTAGWYTKIAGCNYPPAFSAGSTPTAACTAPVRRMKRSPSPAAPTPPPSPRR